MGLPWPLGRIEVRRCRGPLCDLVIAVGLLAAVGVLPPHTPRPHGQLTLDGRIVSAAGRVRGLREEIEGLREEMGCAVPIAA